MLTDVATKSCARMLPAEATSTSSLLRNMADQYLFSSGLQLDQHNGLILVLLSHRVINFLMEQNLPRRLGTYCVPSRDLSFCLR